MINRFTVEGRLTRDVSLKKTNSGKSAVEFDIACTRNRKNDNGEYESDFFTCKAWGVTAEYIADYGKKGMRTFIEGRVQIRKYEGRDGSQRTATEIIVDNISLISQNQAGNVSKKPYTSETSKDDGNYHETYRYAEKAEKQASEADSETSYYLNGIEEDLPF